jgi:hypothetical protein
VDEGPDGIDHERDDFAGNGQQQLDTSQNDLERDFEGFFDCSFDPF